MLRATRIVTKTALREHITPVLKELQYWLPVDMRIEYKILLYTYIALNGLTPEYLCNMVESYAPDRVLRSASQNLLVPRGKELPVWHENIRHGFCYIVEFSEC